ncbi:unannotated protein [freshwater metagenome]|uniref:Unannotated protein n=1 Tax=freshwater metagenome TaxID=449393 RepID=A0A6J6YTL3_9ZZZZ
MGRHGPDFGCALIKQQMGGRNDRSAGVDHVVGQNAQATFDLTDDVKGLSHIGAAFGAALVHEGQIGT